MTIERERTPSEIVLLDSERRAELSNVAHIYADELLGFLRHQTNSPEQAADLRQEVFLRVCRVPLHTISDVRAFLYRIARNLVVDSRRRRRLEGIIFDSCTANENFAAPAPSPETIAADRDELAQFRSAVAELPPHLRQALLWYRLDDVSLSEVGARLGVSERTAVRYIASAVTHCQVRLRRSEH